MTKDEKVYEVTYQASKYGDGPYGSQGTMCDTRLIAASEEEAKRVTESKLEGKVMFYSVLSVRELDASASLKAELRKDAKRGQP